MSVRSNFTVSSAMLGVVAALLSLAFLKFALAPRGVENAIPLSQGGVAGIPVFSGLLAALVSAFFKPRKFSWFKGALLALTSLLAFCFGLMAFLAISAGEVNAYALIVGSVALALVACTYVGWIIIPIGALFGYVFSKKGINKSLKADAVIGTAYGCTRSLFSRATASIGHFFGYAKTVTSLSPALRGSRNLDSAWPA